ncbi:MAG TPA: glutamate--tRNA ligase, partial [Novosphingobium sp.]|nr:glutamate--tRNA ligase [Novosphingobium sp.]
RHAEVAHQLLAAGHAYRCYLTQEELAAMRETAQAEKRPFRIQSPWRDAAEGSQPEGKPYVIRIKAPQSGETVITDLVQGAITVQNTELDDFIILRSDGTPTYMLAVVVDDHDMGVTHVIRGDDHINNAFRQLVILRAMDAIEGGWPDPAYGHIPLIHGADGAKLSKRHGALGVDAYRDDMGLLPEAVINYLMRLGWGHGDEEIISRAQAIEWFDIVNVNKGASRFDFAKLANLNGHYIREADDARLADLVAPRIAGDIDLGLLARAMPVLKPRAKDLNELADGAGFLFAQRPLAISEKAAALLTEDARQLLSDLHALLRKFPETEWALERLEEALKAYAAERNLGLGKLAQPLRAALTGQTTSPGIFDVLVLLGQDEALARIGAQATLATPGAV